MSIGPTEQTMKNDGKIALGVLFCLNKIQIAAAFSFLLAALALIPATADAYASVEGPPQFSAAPGLPDGRIYEQVSPADKNGGQAGASTTDQATGATAHYGLVSADGNAVLFEGTGPMGESPSGENKLFVATKKTGEPGWSTRSLLPAERSGETGIGVYQLDPSRDLSHAMIEATDLTVTSGARCGALGYLVGPDPFVAATWLDRPEIENPVEPCTEHEEAPVGGTPDFSTVYFTYGGTLLPEDSERAPHAGGGFQGSGEAWGFYENHEGVLREAGVLPGQSVSPPFGAVPAASGHGRAIAGNQVSADGSRAFFVSPDPESCEQNAPPYQGHNDCATDPPELYVRENGERTLLVSRDTLLPEAGGLPASAPGGVLAMPNPAVQTTHDGLDTSYVFASPDGSQAFFQSAEALTQAAAELSPGGEPKTYDFDLDTGALTYLPGVVGQIVATDTDGASIAFVRSAVGSVPAELELWSAGAGGGSVTPVVQLSEPEASVPEARMASAGSVLVFSTTSRLSSSFNSGGGVEQIYRYDVPANTLGCVSCAPAGVTPRGGEFGGASFSNLHTNEIAPTEFGGAQSSEGTVDQRGISADGDRIFFASIDPLVPQDSNTNSPEIKCESDAFCPQGRDVYEWENGVVYLISTGKSPLDSYLLDSSENGNDVFFATAEGLVPGDTDGGYDVYDARIPHEGEPYPPAAVPCGGSVCQGPPRVESPLAPPARATFPGSDNLTPEVTPPPAKKVTTKTVKCKKGYVKKKNKCVRKAKPKKAKSQTGGPSNHA
jgi:hypothetical protein